MKVRKATLEDKPEIIRISKMSKFTKGVSNPFVVSTDIYDRGEMGVAESSRHGIVGFVAVRHLVRKPWTSLHYVGVDERMRSKGVGESLVKWALKTSPHGRIRLISEKANPRSHAFYLRLGFEQTGEGANRSGEPYYVFEVTSDRFRASKSKG